MTIQPIVECDSKRISGWQVMRECTESPPVLTYYDDTFYRPLEDPFDPLGEVRNELGQRIESLKIIIIPPCSNATIHFIIEHAINLKQLIIADWNHDRFKIWKDNFECKCDSKTTCIKLSEHPHIARRQLHENLVLYKMDLLTGGSGVYIPKRFRRLDPNLAELLEKTTLKTQQKYCSDAAFRSLHSWHLTVNKLLNLTIKSERRLSDLKIRLKTAVIVGAGPSLDFNVNDLKEFSNEVLIIATDASISTLLNHGIKPHIIVSMDDAALTWRFFAGNSQEIHDIPLIVPYEANHILTRHYTGPIYFIDKDHEDDWFTNLKSARESLSYGQCVGHMAFHAAAHFNPQNIIMIGFDLAFRNDEFHVKDMEVPFNQGKGSTNLVELEGIDGTNVKSDLSMEFYLDYFEQIIAETSINVIDATEGGAKINGTVIMSLQDALTVCDEQLEFETFTQRAGEDPKDSISANIRILDQDVTHLLKQINHARRNPEAYILNYRDQLSSLFCIDDHAYSSLASCSSLLLLAQFRDAMNNAIFPHQIADLVQVFTLLLDDICESGKLVSILLSLSGQDRGNPEALSSSSPVLGLIPGDIKIPCSDIFNRIATDKRTSVSLSTESTLSVIWDTILCKNIDTIVCFEGNIIPDSWSVPDINCIDIKTSFTPKDYERSLWIPNYKVVCIDDQILSEWQDYLPSDISFTSLKDYVSNGQ